MKRLLSALLVILCFTMCNRDMTITREDVSIEPEVTIESMVRDLYVNYPNADYDFVKTYVCERLHIDPADLVSTRSDYQPSSVALDLISQITEVDPSTFESKEDYIACLQGFADTQKERLSEIEFEAIGVGIIVAAEIIELKFGTSDTRTFKEWCQRQWENWGKCVAATVGGAGLGAIAGAGLGAIEGCVVGSVPGAIIGGVCGGLSGAADAC